MTFKEFWKNKATKIYIKLSTGEEEQFDMPTELAEEIWEAGIKEAIKIIRWLDGEVKSGADDYEGSDEVERFLKENDL